MQCLCMTDWIIKGEGFQREKKVIKEKHLKVRSSQNRTVLPRRWSAPQEGSLWDFSHCHFPSDFENNHWKHCANFFFSNSWFPLLPLSFQDKFSTYNCLIYVRGTLGKRRKRAATRDEERGQQMRRQDPTKEQDAEDHVLKHRYHQEITEILERGTVDFPLHME